MLRLGLIGILAIAMFISAPTWAHDSGGDVSSMRCKELLAAPADKEATIAAYVIGYRDGAAHYATQIGSPASSSPSEGAPDPGQRAAETIDAQSVIAGCQANAGALVVDSFQSSGLASSSVAP